MTINYLILAHTNYEHLDKLIEALDAPDVNFFIHIDKKSKLYQNDKGNVFFVKDREKVNWGGFGMIKATIKLMRLAQDKSGSGFYCLMSGADYPVQSNEKIKEVLSQGFERFSIHAVPLPDKPMSRYEYYHFAFRYRKLMALSERIIVGLSRLFNFKRNIPFKIYAGPQWFALSHECITFILKEIESNPDYIDFFRYVKIPDEAFFHTIIGNSKFSERLKPSVTFADWSTEPAPAQISEKHIKKIKNKQDTGDSDIALFARKFTNNDESLLSTIEEVLRSNDK